MNRTAQAAVAAAIALSSVTFSAHAQIASLLKGTPAERFNEEDNRRLVEALRRALDEGAENRPVEWTNPATNHRGDATVTKNFESRGRACKELRLRNEADGRHGESNLNACLIDGRWRLLGSSQL